MNTAVSLLYAHFHFQVAVHTEEVVHLAQYHQNEPKGYFIGYSPSLTSNKHLLVPIAWSISKLSRSKMRKQNRAYKNYPVSHHGDYAWK